MSVAFGISGMIGFIVVLIGLIVAAVRKKPKKPYVIGLLACFVLFIVGVSLPSDNAAPTAVPSSAQSASQIASSPTATSSNIPSSVPDSGTVKVDYKKLYKDYEDNPINADKIYRDKKLEITGKIANIDRDVGQSPYITFFVDEYGAKSIKMSFNDDDPVATLKKGQKVTVTGNCSGMFATVLVVLNDCTIVK